jgi:predicted RNA binding protein YcfA (HicA-like mRNA interferase family)
MKLPKISSKELIKFLSRKRFFLHHVKGSHFVLIKENKQRVVIPKRNEIATGTFLAILRETQISREEIIQYFSKNKNKKRRRNKIV